jgi:hypothetical protein
LKLKQVCILPAHDDLQNLMQIKKSFRLIYLKSTPDDRIDVLQLDF